MKKQSAAFKRRRFERVVFLVDITTIFGQDDCKLYAAHIYNSVWRILEQCNEHSKLSTMWGYKLFDPSLPPLASRSKIGALLGGIPMCEQFDATATNLEIFGNMLYTLLYTGRDYAPSETGRAEYVVRALQEVIAGYAWDPLFATESSSSDEEKRCPMSNERLGINEGKPDSNVIILFSSLPSTWKETAVFLNSPEVDRHRRDADVLHGLTRAFQPVQKLLKSRSIQVGWIDVPMKQDLWSPERLKMASTSQSVRSLIAQGLCDVVRSFIALDLLVVCPTLVPLDLVWNRMVHPGLEPGVALETDVQWRDRQDVTTPLCHVEMQLLNVPYASAVDEFSLQISKRLRAAGKVDIVLGSLWPKSSLSMKVSFVRFLAQRISGTASLSSCATDSLGDQILHLLHQNVGAFQPGQLAWPLFLLRLACEKSICEVSINDTDGFCCKAILEPFTFHSSILTVVEEEMKLITDISVSTSSICEVPISNEDSDAGQLRGLSVAKEIGEKSRENVLGKLGSGDRRAVYIVPSRKRRRVEREVGINLKVGHEFYRGVPGCEERISWVEFWGRVQRSTKLWTFPCSLMSKYIEDGNASQLLPTMDTYLKKQPSDLLDVSSEAGAGCMGTCVVSESGLEGNLSRTELGVGENMSEGRCLFSSNFGGLVDYASDSNDEISAAPDLEIGQNAKDLSVLDGAYHKVFSISDLQLKDEKRVPAKKTVKRKRRKRLWQ